MTARPVVPVDARLAEIEQRAKRARYVTLMGGYGETGDARELLSKDVPWLLSQLRDAQAEIESARFRRDQAYDERDAALTNSDALRVENAALQAENERLRERPTYRITGVRACKIHAESFRVVEADRAAAEARAQALEAKVQVVEALCEVVKGRMMATARVDELDAALAAAEHDEPALPESMLTGPATFEFDEQDEPKRCEHGFTDAHAVIETSFAPPPHPRCPGPVSQPTEGAAE